LSYGPEKRTNASKAAFCQRQNYPHKTAEYVS